MADTDAPIAIPDAALLRPFKTSANFCHACGMLLRLDSAPASSIACIFCKTTVATSKLVGEEFSTKRQMKAKEWLRDTAAAEDADRATIEQDCEKCDNNLMFFYSRQQRSVDEGQTVFYTCTKCGHTEAQNT